MKYKIINSNVVTIQISDFHIFTYICIYMHTYIHTYILLLFISMLWHKQAIFESKGDKLSSSAESRIRTNQGLRHQIASGLNDRWQTDWAIEDQAKNLNSTARPYDQQALSPPDPTAIWHSHLALAIYIHTYIHTCLLLLISMLWHRQAIFESKVEKLSSSAEGRIRTQGLKYLFTSRLNACWQTDWAIEDQAKPWTRQPVPMISKHSAHSTLLPIGFRTWLWRYTCLLLLISMLWHRQAIFESKGDKLSSSAEGIHTYTKNPEPTRMITYRTSRTPHMIIYINIYIYIQNIQNPLVWLMAS